MVRVLHAFQEEGVRHKINRTPKGQVVAIGG
jgi:hypothetical protein